MILGRTLKYASFIIVTLITINNIATHTLTNSWKPTALLAVSPYDLVIANDINILSEIKERKTMLDLADYLPEIDNELAIINLQKEFIEIKRKYIYNENIKSHLIECHFILYQNFAEIKSCTYNEKIYQLLNKITQNSNYKEKNKIKNYWYDPLEKEKISKKLIASIYEKLLSHEFYKYYLKKYLGEDGIANPAKNIELAFSLLNSPPLIEKIDNLSLKKENITEGTYIKLNVFEYNFLSYSCETKLENKILSLPQDQLMRAPLNSPPITVETKCIDIPPTSLTPKK